MEIPFKAPLVPLTETGVITCFPPLYAELAAPDADIFSTWDDGLCNTISGTSMASPHVAGTAALALASGILADLNGDGTVGNVDARLWLQQTAGDLGPVDEDPEYGHCR